MSQPSQQNEDAFVIPNALFLTIRCICVCATIVILAYLFVPRTQQPRRLWTPIAIATNGDSTIIGESRQLEFWTPSSKTKDFLHKENGQVVPTEKWEIISNDDPDLQFGMTLRTNTDILGYRRVEVWGQGRTNYKPGWWWTLDVLTNYTASDLARSYESFWKSHQIIFVEVIDNRGNEK
jgi:hypothetical protein